MITVTSKVEGIEFSVNIDHIICIDSHLRLTTGGGRMIRETRECIVKRIENARNIRATIWYEAKRREGLGK